MNKFNQFLLSMTALRFNYYFLFVLFIYSPSISTTNNTFSSSDVHANSLRLSKSILPVDYDLHLKPNHTNETFNGQISITIMVTESTEIVKLHAHKLLINTIEVDDLNNSKPLAVNRYYFDTKKQFLVIILNESLIVSQQYLIKIDYSGKIDNKTGYFERTIQVNNKTCQFSATMLQKTFARQAFPCFDEPNFKATIKLRITHNSSLIALANMPVESVEENGDETATTTFIRSPVKLSTYLMAWVVGCFEPIEKKTSRGLKIRFFTHSNHSRRLTVYSSEIAIKILEFYEDYFEMPFPLPKLDFVHMHKYPAGGMENWGLIEMDEITLFDPNALSYIYKKDCAKIISHELAHNWFGDLVTMDWWDDIWLNEGFTSFIEYKGLAVVYPKWEPEQHFLDRCQNALSADSSPTIQPVVQRIDDPTNDVKKGYSISYNKGACVVRMLENYIGREALRTAIRNYVKKFRERNAKSSDLWVEVNAVVKKSDVSIKNISHLMDKWINDKNFPVVNVRRTKNGLILKQSRFIITNQSSTKEKLDHHPWIIPIGIVTQKSVAKKPIVLDKHEAVFQLKISKDEWFKLNNQQAGYFIVNYTAEDWQRLTNELHKNHRFLSPMDRSNLLFDSFQLANAGHLSYSIAFNLLDYLKNEDHAIPWATAYHRVFPELFKIMPDTSEHWCLRRMLKDVSMKQHKKLNWDLRDDEKKLLNQRYFRQLVLSTACRNRNEDCLRKANRYLMKQVEGDLSINTDLRFNFDTKIASLHTGNGIIYENGMKLEKDVNKWKKVFNKYMNPTGLFKSEAWGRNRLLKAMAGVVDERLLQTVVTNLAMNRSVGKKESNDMFWLLQTIVDENDIGRTIVWSAIQNKPIALFELSAKNTANNVSKILEKLSENFIEKKHVGEMERFLNKHLNNFNGTFKANLKKLLNQRREWISKEKQNKNALIKWLVEFVGLRKSCKNWKINKKKNNLRFTWKCCLTT